jgi:hypothetical protein
VLSVCNNSESAIASSDFPIDCFTHLKGTWTGKLVPVNATANLIQPSRKEFLALAKAHTLVPIYRTLTADLETPVSA